MQFSKLHLYIFASFTALLVTGIRVIAPHDGNFFRSVVALTISRWFNLALCNAGIALLLASFWTVVRVFFEKLHPLENTNLQERFFVFAAESILGIAMVKGSVTTVDAVLFLCTCAVSMLHMTLVKRLVMMEESAMPTTKRRIISSSLLSGFLFVVDASVALWLGSLVWGSTATTDRASSGRSAGIVLLLLLEWSLNIMQCLTATLKLGLMAFSARFPSEVTNSVRFYVEIITELLRAVIYVVFGGAMLQQSTMPLHLVREILTNVKRIAVLVKDFVQHRKRMKWIEQVDLPTAEQLAADCFCNICRDEVTHAPSARMLPCGHLFHVDCLAKWLERNRDCPYCQRDVEHMINDFVAAKRRAEMIAAGGVGEQQQQQQGDEQQQQQQTQAQAAAAGDQQQQAQPQHRPIFRTELRVQGGGGGAAAAAPAAGPMNEEAMRSLYEAYRKAALAAQEAKQRGVTGAAPAAASSGPTTAAEAAPRHSAAQGTPLVLDSSSSSDEGNAHDDDDDDLDAEFVIDDALSPNTKQVISSASASQNSVSFHPSAANGQDTRRILDAYRRYQNSIEIARKTLKRELTVIRHGQRKQKQQQQQQQQQQQPAAAAAAAAADSVSTNDAGEKALVFSTSNTLAAAAAAAASSTAAPGSAVGDEQKQHQEEEEPVRGEAE